MDWGIIYEVQQGCMPCGIGSFESIIDKIDLSYLTESGEFEGSPDISYAL